MNSHVAPGQLLLTLHGSVALSPFRVEKLVAGFKPGLRAAVAVDTRFVHFALLAGPPTDAESGVLGKILTYGTPGTGQPKGELRVVPGSFVAPWLVVLYWKPDGARLTRAIVLLPDMAGEQDLRRLRVLLRWGITV